MIHDYAELKTTPQVIELEFKMKPEEFDKLFLAWLEAQTKRTVDGFDDWKKSVKTISAKVREKQVGRRYPRRRSRPRSVSRLRRSRQRLRSSSGGLSGQGR